NNKPVAIVKPNDSVIFYNFRPDRAREITHAFCDPNFNNFDRQNGFFPLFYVCMTDYDPTIPNKTVAYCEHSLDMVLGRYLSNKGLTQLRLAETTKYAHVTFFFNAGAEQPYANESRILIPTPTVATYDLQPEMSAYGIADAAVSAVESCEYDVIVMNFANADMVGHTGIFDAAVAAIEAVDECVGKVADAVIKADGQMFICADHGNSDQMIDYNTGEPMTAHTTNPVPFILVNCKKAKGLAGGGKLCDIAPTLLDMMDIEKPKEMTGRSLLIG
ncbi:MAG: 2,3-bisphosphoglycerate-independent phosphoglycerate mutase, partial [Defluviitaleaceae bacterium]|nr:2,3-bisphosphoglycerate-independent phosphoglycerate mutase [Defluviitaleaceae bacterium]